MTSCSSTWTLLLLLPLFIGFHRTSSALPVKLNVEFKQNLERLGKAVMNCENCDSVTVTNKHCQCFNFSVPQKDKTNQCLSFSEPQPECPFPDSFISGLTFLNSTLSKQHEIRHLIRRLRLISWDHEVKQRFWNLTVNYNFNISNVSTVATISPKTFHKYLVDLTQQYNIKYESATN